MIKKPNNWNEVQEISDSDNRDWDFGYIEHAEYHVTVTPISNTPSLKAAPFHGTTPQFKWEDKQ